MPCNSDHLQQTPFEAQMQLAAQLAVFVADKLQVALPYGVQNAASEYYAKDMGQTEWLCEQLSGMTEKQLNEIVYDGRNEVSRKLADWWEAHQKADREREAYEAEHERLNTLPDRLRARAEGMWLEQADRDLLREAAEALS